MAREMGLLEHLDELRGRLIRILVVVVAIAAASFSVGIKEFDLAGYRLPLPYPDPQLNLAAQLIAKVKTDMLPPSVKLIVTAPGQALLAQVQMSIFLGVLLGMPYVIWQVTKFVNPALYPAEKRMITRVLLPGTILFGLGVAFSYLFMTPFTLQFLYGYAEVIGAEQFITIDALMGFVLLFLLAFGLSFQLPIGMWAVTKAGVVDPGFWKRNFTYAVVAFAIYGAVITPDGSGVTMWFVALPLVLLYGLAYLLVRRTKKPDSSQESQKAGKDQGSNP